MTARNFDIGHNCPGQILQGKILINDETAKSSGIHAEHEWGRSSSQSRLLCACETENMV
jgi:hypothetical protein